MSNEEKNLLLPALYIDTLLVKICIEFSHCIGSVMWTVRELPLDFLSAFLTATRVIT